MCRPRSFRNGIVKERAREGETERERARARGRKRTLFKWWLLSDSLVFVYPSPVC
jgi:hypothetical protein